MLVTRTVVYSKEQDKCYHHLDNNTKDENKHDPQWASPNCPLLSGTRNYLK